MTFLLMANGHILAKCETLEDAHERMKKLQNIASMLGIVNEAKWYILETV